MPKVGCKCGYVFNLTIIPNPHRFYYQRARDDPDGDRLRENIAAALKDSGDKPFDEVLEDAMWAVYKNREKGLECPQCGRLWIDQDEEGRYKAYLPETG